MNFILLLPTEIVIQKKIDKLIVEDAFGSFCILPGQADITTILAKGIIIISEGEHKCYLAIEGGFLVKKHNDLYISVQSAIIGENFKALFVENKTNLKKINAKKNKIKPFLAKLEADFKKQITDIKNLNLPDKE